MKKTISRDQNLDMLNECPVEIANYLDYTDTFEVTFRVPLEDSAECITQEQLKSIKGNFIMKFNVTEVEFDFNDDYANGFKLTFDEGIELRDLALGVWEADDDEDDLVDEITAASGWCIKSIDYDIQLK